MRDKTVLINNYAQLNGVSYIEHDDNELILGTHKLYLVRETYLRDEDIHDQKDRDKKILDRIEQLYIKDGRVTDEYDIDLFQINRARVTEQDFIYIYGYLNFNECDFSWMEFQYDPNTKLWTNANRESYDDEDIYLSFTEYISDAAHERERT